VKNDTASSLAPIASGSVSGDISRSASRRAPPPVTVRSIARNSEPSRPPDRVRNNSRLARVAGSMNSVVPDCSRSGRDERRPLGDLRLFDIGDDAEMADSSARENAPKLSGVATP
jgi:hypothetical protein